MVHALSRWQTVRLCSLGEAIAEGTESIFLRLLHSGGQDLLDRPARLATPTLLRLPNLGS